MENWQGGCIMDPKTGEFLDESLENSEMFKKHQRDAEILGKISDIVNETLVNSLDKLTSMTGSLPITIPDELIHEYLTEVLGLTDAVINVQKRNGEDAYKNTTITVHREENEFWCWKCEIFCLSFSGVAEDLGLTTENSKALDDKEYELWVKNLTVDDIDLIDKMDEMQYDDYWENIENAPDTYAPLKTLYDEVNKGEKDRNLLFHKEDGHTYLNVDKKSVKPLERQMFDYIKITLLNDLKDTNTDYKSFIMEDTFDITEDTHEKVDYSNGLYNADSLYIDALNYVANNHLAEKTKALEKKDKTVTLVDIVKIAVENDYFTVERDTTTNEMCVETHDNIYFPFGSAGSIFEGSAEEFITEHGFTNICMDIAETLEGFIEDGDYAEDALSCLLDIRESDFYFPKNKYHEVLDEWIQKATDKVKEEKDDYEK